MIATSILVCISTLKTMGKYSVTEREENYVQLEELSKIILSNSVRKGTQANTMHKHTYLYSYLMLFSLSVRRGKLVEVLRTFMEKISKEFLDYTRTHWDR